MLFSKQDLKRLIVPLLLEQLLAITIGMADTMMVTSVGEAAVSGVSLVDSITALLINVFSCLATGGAVVASQYLGANEPLKAGKAGKQLMYACVIAGMSLMLVCLLLRNWLLSVIFGTIDIEVMQNAQLYFVFSAISYPFLALYNANAALLRSEGNTKATLYTSIIMNIINIAGNAICIFGLRLGVLGAAIPTLLSRLVGAIMTSFIVVHPDNMIPIPSLKKWEWNGEMLKKILKIGLPTGFEGSFFQLGKLILQSLISSFGTAAIAANAISGSIAGVQTVAGSAIGLAMVTVVGRCVGADESEQAKDYTKKLMKMTYLVVWAINIPIMLCANPLLSIFNLSQEAVDIAYTLVLSHSINVIFTWSISFVLPNALRAAGDAKYTMTISCISMAVFRVTFAYVLANGFGLGVLGVWIAMEIDWLFRGLMFVYRLKTGKWLKHKVI